MTSTAVTPYCDVADPMKRERTRGQLMVGYATRESKTEGCVMIVGVRSICGHNICWCMLHRDGSNIHTGGCGNAMIWLDKGIVGCDVRAADDVSHMHNLQCPKLDSVSYNLHLLMCVLNPPARPSDQADVLRINLPHLTAGTLEGAYVAARLHPGLLAAPDECENGAWH